MSAKLKLVIPPRIILLILSSLYSLWIIYCHFVLHRGAISTITSNRQIRGSLSKIGWSLETSKQASSSSSSSYKNPTTTISITPALPPPLTAYIEHFQYYNNTTTLPTSPITDTHKNPTPFFDFLQPLPLRAQTTTPTTELQTVIYPRVSSCRDIPRHLPVDPGFATTTTSSDGKDDHQLLYTTVHNQHPIFPHRLKDFLPYTPVDNDPFLPWIHDIFSSLDGSRIHFISQNKRRCNNGKEFFLDLYNLEPQVAIMQPISVKRVVVATGDDEDETTTTTTTDGSGKEERYRLSSHEDADADGMETRFLCRFRSLSPNNNNNNTSTTTTTTTTLSKYPYNPEYVNWRRGFDSMLTGSGRDNENVWLSTLRFFCPVPEWLRRDVVTGTAEGKVVLDLVPIRTAPRYNQPYSVRGLSRERRNGFDPGVVYGENHVLPKIEASGRLENIPLCRPPKEGRGTKIDGNDDEDDGKKMKEKKKPHYLVGCVWSSLSYHTRNNSIRLADTLERMREWLEFHLMVGFDHFYVYDNSAANPPHYDNNKQQQQQRPYNDLSFLVSLFGEENVTVVPWPFRSCNNNKPMNQNKGERSSQYAAEASCLDRYGPLTTWLINFDPDEYLVPMGDYDNTTIKDVLKRVEETEPKTKILSLKQTRASLRYDHTTSDSCGGSRSGGDETITTTNPHNHQSYPTCITKHPSSLYLQAYNCEITPTTNPKPSWGWRAQKQIIQPSYVLHHFIHYVQATTASVDQDDNNARTSSSSSSRHYRERAERQANDVTEVTMIHTKTMTSPETKGWAERCTKDSGRWNEKCFVGFAWPLVGASGGDDDDGGGGGNNNRTMEGWYYNCWMNEKVENYWVPRLRTALETRGL